MHVETLSICQSDLRQKIVNHTTEDEMYVQIKDKFKQRNSEKRYEGYKFEEDGIITYKNIIYILNVADLRRIVMDEIHEAPYSSHLGYQKTIAIAKRQYFWPKILLSGCSNCFLISWMTGIWILMDLIHNNSPQVCHIWNINYVLITNKFILFQFVFCVLPFKFLLLQLVLYLYVHFILGNMVNNPLP